MNRLVLGTLICCLIGSGSLLAEESIVSNEQEQRGTTSDTSGLLINDVTEAVISEDLQTLDDKVLIYETEEGFLIRIPREVVLASSGPDDKFLYISLQKNTEKAWLDSDDGEDDIEEGDEEEA